MDRLGFNYDYDPDLSDADAYDLFVTDPDGKARKWQVAMESGTKFYAYLSWYEIGPRDPYLATGKKLLKVAKSRGIKVLADNPRWKSKIMDVANPDWQELFMELVADAVRKGYDGIYFDTWDGYGDIPGISGKPKKLAKLLEANREILLNCRVTYPELDLMLNRGWEVMKRCAEHSNKMLVESVWSSHDGDVKPKASDQLVAKIRAAQSCGYRVNILDYVGSGDLEDAQAICAKAAAINCGCTVMRGSLTSPEVLAVSP